MTLYECNACDWQGPASETVHPKHDETCLVCPKCHETLHLVARTSKPSNAVLAGNAFVARFKREPVSPSDAAWLNGFVIALESNPSETSEPRAPSRHVGGCMCSPCREWRLVQHANTLKLIEDRKS